MASPHERVRFDGPEVLAVAAHLSGSADDSDHECRRVLGNLEFGSFAAGPRYRSGGAAVEAGYRKLRSAFDEWVTTVNANADALRGAAGHYAERDSIAADEWAQVSDSAVMRGEPGGWSR